MKKYLLTTIVAIFLVGCAVDSDELPLVNTVAGVENFDAVMSGDAEYVYGYKTEYFEFQHFVDEEFGYWGGFAQSKAFNMEDGSFLNQYSAYNSAAASGDSFLLYYYDSYNAPCDILCRYEANYNFTTVRLNLTTYTYKSITEEDVNTFARVFTDGDYIKVTFTALLKEMGEGDSVDAYVVDYREGKRFVATNWDMFDISALNGELWGIRMTMETSDVGEWGANTPLYIGLDDLTYSIVFND